jgi:hypothetical protein
VSAAPQAAQNLSVSPTVFPQAGHMRVVGSINLLAVSRSWLWVFRSCVGQATSSASIWPDWTRRVV